jgi:hypothetical protein
MSRRLARWVYALAAVILPAVLLFSLVALLHKNAINFIYKNVDDISDGEMPPTITSFQSGPDVVSTLGGSGEGLNCSLPALTNMFFDPGKDAKGKRHLVLQRFRQACVFHDLCYRHGLATYGYNQNDCDTILQNQAFRLCLYFRSGKAPDAATSCQTDSKLVLAGVRLGGADAYRAWDRSTYFEFDSDPSRSNGFSVSRVVEHPFKPLDRQKYRDDPDQIILAFDNVRSNLSVTCITCKDVPVFQQTRDRYDVSEELQAVGLKRLPDALLGHEDQMLSHTSPVWLPPRRRHAAPHLLVDSTGKNHLIWMTRNNPGDTISCIVLTDAATLLTYTLPKRDACSDDASSQLNMVEVDMFATSPLPIEIPRRTSKSSIFATSISAKPIEKPIEKGAKLADFSENAIAKEEAKSRDLKFCSRSATRSVDRKIEDDDKSKCIPFDDPDVEGGAGLGAFQNFAVVRPGQQILFARDVAPPDTSSWWTRTSQNYLGIEHSPDGLMLLIDVTAPAAEKGPLVSKIKRKVRFNIPDTFDPMMPITRTRDDLRFLSLQKTNDKVGVRIIDFAKDEPKIGDMELVMNGSDVHLHPSWGLRPVLVLETRGTSVTTKLVFSRGEISPGRGATVGPETETESLSLETLVFERIAAAPSDAAFVKTGGAACRVNYTFKSMPDYPCYRPFDPDRPMRASPAARMQASQLLAGHFAGRDGHGIAFPDFCLKTLPIILQPKGDGTFVPSTKSVGVESDIQRTVTCTPLNSSKELSGPIQHRPM